MLAKISLPMSPATLDSAPLTSHQTATTSNCSPWLTPIAYFLGERLVLPAYFQQIRAVGQEYVPSSGPLILAPTHRARWDSLVLPAIMGRSATGRDLHYMVTADEVRGLQGWFIRRLGGFAVNVRSPSIASLRHGIDLLQQQQILVIYPEGGIFRGSQIRRLKPGLARLALQAESQSRQQMGRPLGVKILPVGIHYDSPQPHWRSSVELRIGRPLEVASYLSGRGHKSLLGSDCLKEKARHLTEDLTDALMATSPKPKPSLVSC